MLKVRGMAVFRQMRTAAMLATVTQKWDTAALKFASPPENPIDTERGVVAIGKEMGKSKFGYVAASEDALRDIAVMSVPETKDQLIEGVSYDVRKQGAEAFAEHVKNPKNTGGHYSVPCDISPRGSGKTVLQRQNMLQVARDSGFLAVEIEFNAVQPLVVFEKKANFARLVANRILCYLPRYCAMEWSECLEAIAQDFKWEDESPLSDITKAVEVLKKALNHEGPVLLAVDELAGLPGSGKKNLSDLCAIMDATLRKHNTNNRILLAVPVYNLVDLGTVATDPKRELAQSTAAVFATVTQKKWDMAALKFAPPSTEAIHKMRGVIAISNKGSRKAKTGFVAASSLALRDIAAMSAHEAKDQLIEGVPYVVRRQGTEALAEQVKDPLHNAHRYSLPCNTGPRGSGKTVLQRQNMLQVARDYGFLAVEIEFNGIQPLVKFEKYTNFARLVANRILCYLPKYCSMEWSECLKAIAQDFKLEAEPPLSVVRKAVEALKKALNYEGPVLLAVDELIAPGHPDWTEKPDSGKENLRDLCRIMDETLPERNYNKGIRHNKRILLAVSVYNLVDLGKLVTGSARQLAHQELPPILPVLLDSSVDNCLPDWLKLFFHEERRAAVGEKQLKPYVTVATLLAESGGHPRRVEALIRTVNKLSAKVQKNEKQRSADEVLASVLQAVEKGENTCLKAMNAKLNLRNMGKGLSKFKPERMTYDMDTVNSVLLKYLFTTLDMGDADTLEAAKILRSATTAHYQLVPHDECHIGYLPLPALQSFCVKKPSSCSKYSAYRVHARGIADANLTISDTKFDENKTKEEKKKEIKEKKKERSKHFEMSMFHALCGAVLARERLTKDMFRHSPNNLPETHCTEIEWAKDVELFPSAVENGATLRVCDDETLHRICEVGAFNGEMEKSTKGLAFVPTDKWNTCCDFVLVLPTADEERAGRVVFAVQCKHWAKDVAGKKGDGLHALAYFRYGRHCFEADEVFLQKNKGGAAKRYAHSWRLSVSRTTCIFHSTPNSFQKQFCKIVEQENKDSDTRVVFVLATVNNVTLAGEEVKSVFNGVNLPDEKKYKRTKLLEDEGLMDLQHMCGWCPTVGYGALLAEKLKQFPFAPDDPETSG